MVTSLLKYNYYKQNIIMKVGMVLPEASQQATRENIVQAAKPTFI
jgi:hypothetical protein